MYNDIAIIRELLQRISDATELIQSKISSVQTADDFLQSPDGIIVHEYHRIDEDEIFLIIHRDLPPLKQAVLQMLSLLPLS